MSRIRGKNTTPEMRVRSLLHRLGYRFRLHSTKLPGKPDLVLPKYNAIIFVHGCFWHQHARCRKCNFPNTNTEFWTKKFSQNRERDRNATRALRSAGWRCITVWECETRDETRLISRLNYLLTKSIRRELLTLHPKRKAGSAKRFHS